MNELVARPGRSSSFPPQTPSDSRDASTSVTLSAGEVVLGKRRDVLLKEDSSVCTDTRAPRILSDIKSQHVCLVIFCLLFSTMFLRSGPAPA